MASSNPHSSRRRKKSGDILSSEQLFDIESKKRKAQEIRQARATTLAITQMLTAGGSCGKEKSKKIVDTEGGFFLEEADFQNNDTKRKAKVKEAGEIEASRCYTCSTCELPFGESYLSKNFDLSVCNNCRDRDGEHKLITKTDARARFCLKDCDFDSREPELKFVRKKNPHNSQWGEMKLYLLSQIKDRAVEVWGSEKDLEQEIERRVDLKEKAKEKQFQKSINELRRNVRASLYKKVSEGHKHEYGPEAYDEGEDTYSKTCSTCGHVNTYEKM